MAALVKVVMTRTAEGYPDGVNKREYKGGEVASLPAMLAECFIAMGVAVPWVAQEPPKVVGPTEFKPAAPEEVKTAPPNPRLADIPKGNPLADWGAKKGKGKK